MKKADLTKLQSVNTAMAAAPGYLLATKKEMKAVEAAGLVESNADISEGDKIAYRLTATGSAAVANPETAPAPAAAAPKPAFEISDNVPIPEKPRKTREGGGRTETYPFSQLAVNQSFFTPQKDGVEDMEKSFASTLTNAHKRFEKMHAANPAEPLRRFTARNVTEPRSNDGGVTSYQVKGLRVWRVADAVPTPDAAPAADAPAGVPTGPQDPSATQGAMA